MRAPGRWGGQSFRRLDQFREHGELNCLTPWSCREGHQRRLGHGGGGLGFKAQIQQDNDIGEVPKICHKNDRVRQAREANIEPEMTRSSERTII